MQKSEENIATVETYKVVFRGTVLAEYEENPIDRLLDINEKLADTKELNAKMVTENAMLEHEKNELSEELGTTNANLGKARRQRDTAVSTVSQLENEVKKQDKNVEILNDSLNKKQPLKRYSGLSLILKGIKKVLRRKIVK